MTTVPSNIWAADIKWDSVALGPKMKTESACVYCSNLFYCGDGSYCGQDIGIETDFEYVYNENAVAQVIHLAIRDTEYTPQMINAHPAKLQLLLNQLKDELEDNEWSVALGSISLDIDFDTKQLVFTGKTESVNPQSIRVALDLTKGDKET